MKKTTRPSAPRVEHARLASSHPLLRIAVAAALATTITGLGGLLFGPISEARTRQLAAAFTVTPAKGALAAARLPAPLPHNVVDRHPTGSVPPTRTSG